MLDDFKQFVMRGSVVDMAVGIVIGAAFATVVQSFVDDILMPPIGLLLGGVDFSNLFITLGAGNYDNLAAAQQAGAATIKYGLFIGSIISFLIVGAAMFLVIMAVSRLKPEEPEGERTTKKCPDCLSGIPMEAQRCAFCTTWLEQPEASRHSPRGRRVPGADGRSSTLPQAEGPRPADRPPQFRLYAAVAPTGLPSRDALPSLTACLSCCKSRT